MHDVDRNSILHKDWDEKKKRYGTGRNEAHHEHGSHANHHQDHSSAGHAHGKGHSHEHDRHDHPPHDHGQGSDARMREANHDHFHSNAAYEDHDFDDHEHDDHHDDVHGSSHSHGGRFSRDRVFTHLHPHKHVFYHDHPHTHDPEHRTLMHKLFKDPVRDWFGVGVMLLMILTGHFQLLTESLSGGLLVCAAMIGLFPALKNAFFATIHNRKPTLELLAGLVLVAGLLTGNFLEVALCALFMLMGSFMNLDFSWRG